MSVNDHKSVIEELRAEFAKLESGVAARCHALLDALIEHGPAVEVKVDAERVASEVAKDAESAVAAEVKP